MPRNWVDPAGGVIDAPARDWERTHPSILRRDQFNFSNKSEFVLNCGKVSPRYDEIGYKSVWDWITDYSIFHRPAIRRNGRASRSDYSRICWAPGYKWRLWLRSSLRMDFQRFVPAFSRDIINRRRWPLALAKSPKIGAGVKLKRKKERSG